MKSLFSLVMMQLKDKLDLSKKSFKAHLFKIVFTVLKFILLTAVIFLAFYIVSFLKWLSLEGGIPQKALVVIITFMLVLSLIACTIKIMDSLYFSKDNTFLLTMPVSKEKLFLSKLILFYLYELIKNFSFMMPLFIAFGMINSYPLYFYLWLIPCLMLVTLIEVALAGLLSIPSMAISIFMKKHLWVKTICVTILLSVAVVLIIKLIGLIPENFNFVETWSTTFWQIQDFLTKFSEVNIPFSVLTEFIVGNKTGYVVLFNQNTITYFLYMVALVLVVLLITFLLVRPLFFKMASIPFEFKKEISNKKGENIKLNPFISFVKKEINLILRMLNKINSLITTSVCMPLVIFLLNKIYMAMDIRPFGSYMTIAFNMLLITLIAQSSNSSLASTLSEEGASAYLLKINPNKYVKSLFPKLIFNMFVITVSIIVSVIIFINYSVLSLHEGILIFFIIELLYLSHALWSGELDIMNPQTDQYSKVGSMINNPNEIKSTLLSFVISILLAIFVFINLTENTLNFYKVWFKILFVCVVFLIFRIYMYITQIKLYYKEK